MARVLIIVVMFGAVFYTLFWLATFTSFFKDGARLRRIAKRIAIFVAAGISTALAVAFLFVVDQIS